MTNKLIKRCAYVSAILFLGFVGLYICVMVFSPNTNLDWSYVSLGEDIHIAVTKGWGGNLVFFDQDTPYTGSIIGFAGDKTVHVSGVTGGGIYFRRITYLAEIDMEKWTLMISLWYPIVFFGLLPFVLTVKTLHRRANQRASSANEN